MHSNSDISSLLVNTQIEQQPENFRTMHALRNTMTHLRAIMDRTDMHLANIHKFLWDRFRGVRQDLFVQGFEVSTHLACYKCCPRTSRCAQYTCAIQPPCFFKEGRFKKPSSCKALSLGVLRCCTGSRRRLLNLHFHPFECASM